MTRSGTTKFLGEILKLRRLRIAGLQYASEVVLDYGTKHPRRIDFVSFEPQDQMSIAGIERGIFSFYEVKSCKEDVFSGNGLSFVGDKNYLVTTMQCHKDLLPSMDSGAFQKQIKTDNPRGI